MLLINKFPPSRISLKLKVALSFSVLFFFASAAVFVLLFVFFSFRVRASLEQAADLTGKNIHQRYVLGSIADRPGIIFDRDHIPASAEEELEKAYPGSEVLYLHRAKASYSDSAPEHFLDTFFVYRDGHYYEVRLSDENPYSREIRPSLTFQPLKRHLDRLVYMRGRENFAVTLYGKDGASILSGDPGFDALPSPLNSAKPVHMVSRTQLPDGGYIEIRRNIEPLDREIRRLATLAFSILGGISVIGCVISWLIAKRFIGGIQRVTEAARIASSGNYSSRVPSVESDREVCDLIDTFNRMNEKTEELMLELRMVTDSIAHDLRTPLTRISGMIEVAITKQEPQKQDLLSVCISVAEECERLKNMINIMLEITRTNDRKTVLHAEKIDLSGLLAEAHELLLPLAEEKKQRFLLDVPVSGLFIDADKTRLQRLVANLLENAMKFTPEHGEISLRAVCGEDGTTSLVVRDTGCGISPDDLPHVFERFFRSDNSRNLPGNGLGLSLVQAIVNAHAWSISCESEPGRGTAFTVLIPAPHPDSGPSASEEGIRSHP